MWLMLAHRLRRWSNIKSAFGQRIIVFAVETYLYVLKHVTRWRKQARKKYNEQAQGEVFQTKKIEIKKLKHNRNVYIW